MLFFLNLKKIFYYINVLSIGVPSLKGFNFNNNIVNINFNKKYKISVKDINLPNFDKIKGKYFKS